MHQRDHATHFAEALRSNGLQVFKVVAVLGLFVVYCPLSLSSLLFHTTSCPGTMMQDHDSWLRLQENVAGHHAAGVQDPGRDADRAYVEDVCSSSIPLSRYRDAAQTGPVPGSCTKLQHNDVRVRSRDDRRDM